MPVPAAAGLARHSRAAAVCSTPADERLVVLVNTGTANSILFGQFNGLWAPWAAVPGTGVGTQSRSFITGHRTPASGQIGLAWTQGTTTVDVFATALNAGAPSATASVTAPATGSTVAGTVSVTATEGASLAGWSSSWT
jgi:hypothetical protein